MDGRMSLDKRKHMQDTGSLARPDQSNVQPALSHPPGVAIRSRLGEEEGAWGLKDE